MKLRLMIVLLAISFSNPCFSTDLTDDVVSQDKRSVADQLKAEFFERTIRPLLAKHCYECHSAETAANSGHLALDAREGLLNGGTRGPILIAGNADESLLISAVRYSDPKLQMPPDGKLPTAEIDQLVEWVNQGGYVPDYGTSLQKKTKEIDWATARDFWSFRRLETIQPPDSSKNIGQQTLTLPLQPVDSFIFDRIAANGLSPSPIADKRTLARRLSFDLLGVPPVLEELDDYCSDASPDGYERLVDRFLASPQFGERWARYWLDLVRYTDVTPSWLKNADQAWLYRDWVVAAINSDLPYDEFVTRQLAADLLDHPSPEDYAALGLIGLSPTYWKELRLAPSVIEVIVADEWDERIDAVSRTFLGLTVACARCHDHKFDPITSRDYYALAGMFASTQLTDRPLLASPLAEQIVEARRNADLLEEKLKAQPDKESEAAKKIKAEIDEIKKSTPQFDARMAHTVEEASIFVLPDGPEMTRLDVRKKLPRDLPIFRRGNPGNPGEIVQRRFIEVLSPTTPGPFVKGSGRLEFTKALFDEAKGLTARVMVNRIWSNHFGRGLVKTPSDFGAQGDRPTHPELLEWLATDFAGNQFAESKISSRWSLKRMHRQIVNSTTYRQVSQNESIQTDPENQWLARMNRRRLDVEPWRDAILCAAGNLDVNMGGPANDLDLPTNNRRTIYGRVGRDEQNDLLRLYDFPPPTSHSPGRDATTTPLQQLFVLNSEFIETQARSLSAKIQERIPNGTARERIDLCYQFLFQRDPTENERQLGIRFLASSPIEKTEANDKRWPLYVQSLFGLNELLFVD